jgi:hypothetical protein
MKTAPKQFVFFLIEVGPNSQICGFCGSNTVPPDDSCPEVDFSLRGKRYFNLSKQKLEKDWKRIRESLFVVSIDYVFDASGLRCQHYGLHQLAGLC